MTLRCSIKDKLQRNSSRAKAKLAVVPCDTTPTLLDIQRLDLPFVIPMFTAYSATVNDKCIGLLNLHLYLPYCI
jgi:hypothetical protein